MVLLELFTTQVVELDVPEGDRPGVVLMLFDPGDLALQVVLIAVSQITGRDDLAVQVVGAERSEQTLRRFNSGLDESVLQVERVQSGGLRGVQAVSDGVFDGELELREDQATLQEFKISGG